MLQLSLNPDSTGLVSDSNPIQTKHSSEGEPVIASVYLSNDGKRANVPTDTVGQVPLIYTNIRIQVQGVAYVLQSALTADISVVNLTFDNTSGWNIGTIITAGLERMRIESVTNTTTVRVQRNYTADGKSSTLSSHSVGTVFTAETSSVSIALPDPNDVTQNTAGTFSVGTINTGVDPSILTTAIDNQETTNTIVSNNGLLYKKDSLIKIDNEIMKVVAVVGNNIQVLRGYTSTRSAHTPGSIIYCVGIVDIAPTTHKIFVKNDPPSGLPTQKKRDVQIVLLADEEPL
jgi:hypothetical protein